MTTNPRERRGRWPNLTRSGDMPKGVDPFVLSVKDMDEQRARFGVDPGQVMHDFVISHVLSAISSESDKFVFYGGTALSRTHLDGLRLSEDIDLLSLGPRREAAFAIDRAITSSLSRHFEGVAGAPPL